MFSNCIQEKKKHYYLRIAQPCYEIVLTEEIGWYRPSPKFQTTVVGL